MVSKEETLPVSSIFFITYNAFKILLLQVQYPFVENYFPEMFRLPPLMYVRKPVSGFGKKTCACTGVRKPRNT